jgi:phosphoserine phosphatase
MPTAVFDFDETLVYLPSALIWSRMIPLQKKLQFPFLFFIEKIFRVPWYHGKTFEWMVGKDLSKTIERMRSLPPVPGGVAFFRQVSVQGYKMIVMSYSPGVFVSSWLSANGLKAELICPNFVMTGSVVQDVSGDPVTQAYLKEPKDAKARVLAKMGIKPDICVGDNRRRDGLCDKYVDVRDLEPRYKHKIRQIVENLDRFF